MKRVLPFSVAVAAATIAALPIRAAKNPDKPDKADKFERKLERASMADLVAAVPAPAPAQDRSGRSDRSSRSDRGGREESRAVPSGPADPKFDAFRLVVERNIFNPNRIGRTRERSEEKAPRVDSIALVGTMQSDRGVVAFFDSPDPALRKALREGQSVGEFKVNRIQPDGVELSRGDKPVSLKVAQQLRRPEGGEWTVAAVEPPSDDRAPGSADAGSSSEPAAPPPIPADASDVVRRMMEQRQKQLKQ